MQTTLRHGVEGDFIKSQLAQVSRQYSLIVLRNPNLYPRRKRVRFSQAIQVALSYDIKFLFEGNASVYIGISLLVRRLIPSKRLIRHE